MPEIAGNSEARLALIAGELRAGSGRIGLDTGGIHPAFPDLSGPITAIFETIAERREEAAVGEGPAEGDDLTEPYGRAGEHRPRGSRQIRNSSTDTGSSASSGRAGSGRSTCAGRAAGPLGGDQGPAPRPGLSRRGRRRLLREAADPRGLDHEHIVPVYDVGCTPDGHCFVVSKLIDGEGLTSGPVASGRVRRGSPG